MTNLAGLKESILDKIRHVYPKYLSLVAYENGKTAIDQMREKVEGLEESNKRLAERLKESEKFMRHLLKL